MASLAGVLRWTPESARRAIVLRIRSASAPPPLSDFRIGADIGNDNLRVGLEILVFVGDHRYVAPWPPSDQPEEDRLGHAVQNVYDWSGEVELFAQHDHPDDR